MNYQTLICCECHDDAPNMKAICGECHEKLHDQIEAIAAHHSLRSVQDGERIVELEAEIRHHVSERAILSSRLEACESEQWRQLDDTPVDGESIWLLMLEWDGDNRHVDYGVVWYDVDGPLVRRFEHDDDDDYGEAWPPTRAIGWMPCNIPMPAVSEAVAGTPESQSADAEGMGN